MRKGQISIGLLVSITIGLLGAISTVYFKNDSKAQSAKDDVSMLKADLSGVNVKLDFLLGKYGVRFDSQKGVVETISTSTYDRR
jgi:hypothetical protein